MGRAVYIFTDRVIDKVGKPITLQQLKAYEENDGGRVYYHPLLASTARTIQGYTRVLQDCVADLLSLNLPPAEKVPEIFYR